MNVVFPLLVRLFTGETGNFFEKLKRLAGLYVLVALFSIALVFFLAMALFVWSARHIGTLETSLVFAGAVFIILILLVIAISLAKRKPKREADDRLQRDIASIAGIAALSNAPQLFRAVKRNGVVVVPIAGALAIGAYALLRRKDKM